jgi:hypothetical protein
LAERDYHAVASTVLKLNDGGQPYVKDQEEFICEVREREIERKRKEKERKKNSKTGGGHMCVHLCVLLECLIVLNGSPSLLVLIFFI